MKRAMIGLGLAVLLLAGCPRAEAAAETEQEGRGRPAVICPAGYWAYDGELFEQEALPGAEGYRPFLLVRQHTEVCGYELLDEAAQHAFDLCYGEYFSANIRDDGIPARGKTYPFSYFTMPQPLTREEWAAAKALYEAATISYSYRPFRYACGDQTVGKVNCLGDRCPCRQPDLYYHFYVGGTTFAEKELNFAFDRLGQMADKILAGMDESLPEAQKCAFLAQYLTGHVSYFTDHYWEKKIVGNFTVLNSDAPFITAYGALAGGEANCFGYARAFDFLAKRAGLTSLVVLACNETDEIGHAWNMVKVDGAWYQLDVTWMDNETSGPDLRWFLFEGGEPEHDYYHVQSYGRSAFPLPECSAKPYPALLL